MAMVRASSLDTGLCSLMASTICSPIECSGLNDAIGSCGMSAMSPPRIWRMRRP